MEPITPPAVLAYLRTFNENVIPEELRTILKEVEQRHDIVPPVSMETGLMLKLLVELVKPRRILELGTGMGISTMFMALGLLDGTILTIDHRAHFAEEARQHFFRLKVQDTITILIQDVREAVPRLLDSFDLIFQDAGKTTYGKLLEDVVARLNQGGYLIVDDTLLPAMVLPKQNERSKRSVDAFNRQIASHPRLHAVQFPMGKGLTIAKKI